MNKKLIILALAAFSLTACDNNNSVNILVSNTYTEPQRNKTVTIGLDEVHQWLGTTNADTLILLDERNQPLPYIYDASRSSIRFTVPVIQGRSQKNYTLNKSATRLRQNILAFRRKSIEVELK